MIMILLRELQWMDEILHDLRKPGMIIPLEIPTRNGFSWFEVVQDFGHPLYDPIGHSCGVLTVACMIAECELFTRS